MSEFYCEVVKIGPVTKHENADTLSVTEVFGWPVVFRTGEYQEGDLAVYIPVDAIVPDTEQWSFLKGHRRIKAKRLRGIYSQGMLAPLPLLKAAPEVGQNVQELMGITKWEPTVDYKFRSAEVEHFPGTAPVYDIESLMRYKHLLEEGLPVSLTEKIHGCNARFSFKDGRLWCGSRNNWWKEETANLWWATARKYDLETVLARVPGLVLYGEIYGANVQDLKYGAANGENFLRFFDIYDESTRRWLDVVDFRRTCETQGLDTVPVLYEGPWNPDLVNLCEGTSTLASHCREGFVLKPMTEQITHAIGRLILKAVGQTYHMRKGE